MPKELKKSQRLKIAKDVIEHILTRTRKGIDQFGKPFKPYSESYKSNSEFISNGKTSLVDLTLTSEMLSGLMLLNQGSGFVKIGFVVGSVANNKASWSKAEDNHVSRKFLGIQSKALSKIVRKQKVPRRTSIEEVNDDFLTGVIVGATSEEDNGEPGE